MSRYTLALGLLPIAFCVALSAAPGPSGAGEIKRYKITDERRRVIGDIYDPGTGGRLQIRDKHRRIIGCIEGDGDVTNQRRCQAG